MTGWTYICGRCGLHILIDDYTKGLIDEHEQKCTGYYHGWVDEVKL